MTTLCAIEHPEFLLQQKIAAATEVVRRRCQRLHLTMTQERECCDKAERVLRDGKSAAKAIMVATRWANGLASVPS